MMSTLRSIQRAQGRAGFTIVELMAAMIVFVIVMTIGLSFVSVETRSFRHGLDEMSTLQSLRYAVGEVERSVLTAGTNLAQGQPELVYVDDDIIAFNADFATRTANDPFAVFYDPDIEDAQAISWKRSAAATIPGSSFTYPDTTYMAGAIRSPAETVILFFAPDTATSRTDDFALFRQVNAGEPQLVANNLLRTDGEPFFRFMTNSTGVVDSVSSAILPLAHTVPIHGSPADTGAVARIDSIVAVRVNVTATNGRTGDLERLASMSRMVSMPNIGFGSLETCGSKPLLGTGVNAAANVLPDGENVVDLTWARSTDEAGGENDVVRYVIWRRIDGEAWEDEPFLSIPAGEAAYTYQDQDVTAGVSYQYQLAAQDCTPTLSDRTASGVVAIPNPVP